MANRDPATLEVVNAVRRITRALRLAAESTRASAGISAAQLFVLRQLSDGEARSIRELADATLTDRTSVATVVDRLEQAGLVHRARSSTDRRRVDVQITTRGLYLLDTAPAAPTSLLVAALDRMTDRQLEQLGGSLRLLVDAMGLGGAPAGMLFEDEERSGAERADRRGMKRAKRDA